MSSLKGVLNSVIFEATFENMDEISKGGATVVGNPTIANDESVFTGGIEFDGTNDYLTYNAASLFNGKTSVSIEIFFKPDFNYDVDSTVQIFYTTLNETYRITKASNAGNNTLDLELGDTTIASIASATYSAYWNQNAMNHMVIAATSGNTDVYLNNNQILTADNTAWTPVAPATLTIGATGAGGNKFDGTFYTTRIYNKKLTADDVANLYNSGLGKGTLFGDLSNDKLLMHMPCISDYDDSGTRRPLLNQNYDYPASYTPTMGDGSTGTTFPTVLNGKGGYSFDGGDYITFGNTPANIDFEYNQPFSVSFWYNPDLAEGKSIISKRDSGGLNEGWEINSFSDTKLDIVMANATQVINVRSDVGTLVPGIWRHILFTYDGSGVYTGINVYYDSIKSAIAGLDTDTITSTWKGAWPFTIGARGTGRNISGDLKDIRIYNYEGSQLQAERLFLSSPNNINL